MNKGKLLIGIDLGGTHYRVALSDEDGNIVARGSYHTEATKGMYSVISRIEESVRETIRPFDNNRITGIGIGVPGPVNPWTGVIFSPPNLPGWDEVPIRDLLESSLQIPVFVGNDANLAALGEFTFGAGVGVQNLVYITVSTGIGGGIIADGRLLLGSRGLAGEIGHMTIDRNGPRCMCGNVGCLEALASGTAIARIAKERIQSGEKSLIAKLAGGNPEKISAELVEEAARQNDSLAEDVMKIAAENLGIGVVNVVHVFNPALVIIGGGVSNAGEMIFGPVTRIVRERVMPSLQEGLIIAPAALGDDAGLMGAIALALDGQS